MAVDELDCISYCNISHDSSRHRWTSWINTSRSDVNHSRIIGVLFIGVSLLGKGQPPNVDRSKTLDSH